MLIDWSVSSRKFVLLNHDLFEKCFLKLVLYLSEV